MSKGNGINRKKLVPFILSIIIFPQNPMQRIFEKQTERRSCRRDSGRNYVLSAGSTEDWKSFVPGLQREAALLCNELAQALHGILVGLGLAHVKGDLVLKVGPAVGGGIVHVHRVPDQVGQEADRILMERHGLHRHAAVGVAPQLRWHGLTGGTVHDLPPAGDVIVGVHLHQLRADALHQRDGHGVTGGGVEAGHNVARRPAPSF